MYKILLCILFFFLIGIAEVIDATETSISTNFSTLDNKILKRQSDAVHSYQDLTKLLISLATGTLVFTPTILRKSKQGRIYKKFILYLAVIFLLISIGAGIGTLSALTGTQFDGYYDISSGWVMYPSLIQWASFFIGLLLFCIFALSNLGENMNSKKSFNKMPEVSSKSEDKNEKITVEEDNQDEQAG